MARPKNNTPRITEKESEILKILWAEGPLTVRQILDHYEEPRPHFNTVSTTVRVLEDKGFVSHEAVSGGYRYFATVDIDDFRKRSIADVVRSFFNNSYKSAVSALVADEKITADELRDILRMIDDKN